MADKQWKKVERAKCTALGGKRTGPRGFGLPDCVGIEVALEVKHYKRYTFLTKDWEQAVENAARVGKPPVLAVKEGGRNGRDCVQMDRNDYYAMRRHADIVPDYLKLGPHFTVRLTWRYFEALYHAVYNKEKCPIG